MKCMVASDLVQLDALEKLEAGRCQYLFLGKPPMPGRQASTVLRIEMAPDLDGCSVAGDPRRLPLTGTGAGRWALAPAWQPSLAQAYCSPIPGRLGAV